jgi:energy-converting hydrogenase Eha subunit H
MLRKLTLVATLATSGLIMNANAVDFDLFLSGSTATDTAVRKLILSAVYQSTEMKRMVCSVCI